MKTQAQPQLETTTEMKEINGKQIPVITHKPVNNGEAANNAEIKDMSPKVLTPAGQLDMQSFMELYKQAQEIFEHNLVENSFKVTKKSTYPGRQKMKTENNVSIPILDDNGDFVYFPDSYFVTVDAKGQDLFIRVSRDDYEMVLEGSFYRFKGHMDWVTNKDKSRTWSAVYTSVLQTY